ncbi:MAG: peptidoglycan editing factor PgeF [Terrimicrobiaceae bacterium]
MLETFEPLTSCPGILHAFLTRVPGIDVDCGKEEALERLRPSHEEAIRQVGLAGYPLALAEQVHGNQVAVARAGITVPGADGLVTDRSGICLGIYVADCAAVFLVDRTRRTIGLVHSGRKGTESGIVGQAVRLMTEEFGSRPKDLLAVISPCIRPPHYEVDFARSIRSQLHTCGIQDVVDTGRCTASQPERYYSYRRESGRTGRMLALLAITK